MRPVAQIKHAAIKYPIQTQIQACHHDRRIWPLLPTIIDEAIIHVFCSNLISICIPHNFIRRRAYDVGGISNPKGDKVPPSPFPALGLD
jgi:hypothetical protein